MRPFLCLVICSATVIDLGQAFAQTGSTRLELGQRLRAFEQAWDAEKDEAKRRLTVKPLNQAVQSFFSFRMAEATRKLDEARLLLLNVNEPGRLWAESLALNLSSRFVDVNDEVRFSVSPFYEVKGDKPKDAEIRVALTTSDGKQRVEFPEAILLTKEYRWPMKDSSFKEGDHIIEVRVGSRDKPLAHWKHTLSLANKPKDRVASLAEATKKVDPTTTDRATLLELTSLVERLHAGQTLETNYSATRLLKEAEELLNAIKSGKRFHGQDRPGEHWLKFAFKKGSVVARVQVPMGAKAPMPLVIALHGAGGSENMFFDGYGDGLITKLCADRGMLLVSPRLPLLPIGPDLVEPIIEEMGKLYPVDEKRVFLVGHSMGAGHALSAVGKIPSKIAGLAALGGGRPIKMNEDIKKVPFFVGVGKEDFARSGATSLAQSLKKAGVSVRFEEYPDIEHLVIVQRALPDVFAFIDEVMKGIKK